MEASVSTPTFQHTHTHASAISTAVDGKEEATSKGCCPSDL